MRQITRWSPDTCSCVIEYEWDDAVDPSVRIHTVYNILSACHGHPGTPDQTFKAAIAANQAKNNPPTLVSQAASFISSLFS